MNRLKAFHLTSLFSIDQNPVKKFTLGDTCSGGESKAIEGRGATAGGGGALGKLSESERKYFVFRLSM